MMKTKQLPIVFVFAFVLLTPAGAFANNNPLDTNDPEQYYTNDIYSNQLEPDFEDTPNEMQQNIETNLTDLSKAHSDITNIMIEQNETELQYYMGPDIPIVMAYVDDDTLVVGLDPTAMYFDVPIEPELIQYILDIDEPVEVKYVAFEEEASASQTKSWQDKYKKSCLPVKPGYQKVCKVYGDIMKRLGIAIPSGTSTTTTTQSPVVTSSSNSPCDDNRRSTACYYYERYEDRCTDGNSHKRCSTYAKIIQRAGYSLPDSTSNPPPVYQPPVVSNVQATQSGDNVRLSWDVSNADKVKYYKIYVTDDNRSNQYKGKISKTATSYTLTNVEEGNSYQFKIKLYYTNERGSSSIKYYNSNTVDIPRTTPVDRIPPVISVPETITVRNSTDSGALVNFVVTATDNTDESVDVQCSSQSGSKFAIGTTTVTCNARDEAGNRATPVTFSIVVELFTSIIALPTEFYGGNQYQLHARAGSNVGNGNSTLTLGVTTNDGINGVIVSGHAANKIDLGLTFVDQGIVVDNEFTSISDVHPTSVNQGNIDAAFIPITQPNIVIGSKVQDLNNVVIDVEQGQLADVPIDEYVNIYGIFTNDRGQLVSKNATITTKAGAVFTNMGVSTYQSIGGDSGAPILYHDGDISKIVGAHKGSICIFDIPDDNRDAFNVEDTRWCVDDTPNESSSEIDRYKTFTAWENIKERFNLQ